MTRVTRAMARSRTTPASFWKFNWIVNHKVIGALRKARRHARGTLLDVGCGSKPFAWIFEGAIDRYVGTDLSSSAYLDEVRPDAYALAEALPVRDASVGTVMCLSVITYLPDPQRFVVEAARVLEPGGHALIEFTQMVPLHDEPHDYFRFTRFGATLLLERAGLEPVEFLPLGGLWTRVGLTTIAKLNRLNRGPARILTELPVRALYVVVQLGCELLDRVFFDPREVVGHLVVARKPPPPRA